jgi:RNA polymerase sigma-70 factor, ECF subfamily
MSDSDPVFAGDAKLWQQVDAELRRLAQAMLRKERVNHTLQATALVNEAYLKLIEQKNLSDVPKSLFFSAAAATMRRILIDHARKVRADKRGGGEAVRMTLSGVDSAGDLSEVDLIDIDDALKELHVMDERAARVVELRFFGGLEREEIAAQLNVSERTIDSEWKWAREWLKKKLASYASDPSREKSE